NIRFQTSYLRDKLGRITQKTETVLGNSNTFDYLYYDSGYLKEVKKDGLVTATYTYDLNGNRENNGALYDDQDRLTSTATATYTYTDNGELLTKTEGAQVTSYTYDVIGNLLSVTLPSGTLIEYVIDASNRRVGKKVDGVLERKWLYKDGLNPIYEEAWDSVNSTWVQTRFVYASRANVPDYLIRDGVTYRIISDHLGSPRLIIDTGSGNVAQALEYDEWGNILSDTYVGAVPLLPFRLAGGLYDADTKLIRFGARDYDPETGRWTAKDPIRFDGDGPNLFGYALNDPITLFDLTGFGGVYGRAGIKGTYLAPGGSFDGTAILGSENGDFRGVTEANANLHAGLGIAFGRFFEFGFFVDDVSDFQQSESLSIDTPLFGISIYLKDDRFQGFGFAGPSLGIAATGSHPDLKFFEFTILDVNFSKLKINKAFCLKRGSRRSVFDRSK
ncbi:MAG: hypothetical protein OEZ51_15400, partial [Nitrospinota bacterium]|nr:hypothetical protein [Nitrospinota bacterium]